MLNEKSKLMANEIRVWEEAVSYMRENLNDFGKKRLEEIYGGESVTDALIAVDTWESILCPTLSLCYDQVNEKPESPEVVYHM